MSIVLQALLAASFPLSPPSASAPAAFVNPSADEASQDAPPESVEWVTSLTAARERAKAEGLPILLYFWLDGSDFCRRMYGETLTAEEGTRELAHFVCASIQADRAEARELVQRFGVARLPTLVFANSEGHAEDAIEGFIPLEGFLAESRRVRRGEGTVSDWRGRAEAAPDDLDVRLRLALQLEHVGQLEECARLQASIKAHDPEGRSVAGAQLHLYDAFAAVRRASPDASDPSTYELAELYRHMLGVTPPEIRFEGWKWIADIEQQRGDRVKERAAWSAVWDSGFDSPLRLDAGFSLLQRFFQMEVELSSEERLLAWSVVEVMTEKAGKGPGQVNPSFVHHAKALGLAINGRREEALREAKEAVELSPEVSIHQRLLSLLQSPAE